MARQAREPLDRLLAGRFELVRQLGEGGYGVVYEALDRETGGRVALKTLQRMEPDALARFKEEFRSLQDVEHPNLVLLSELMSAEGLWFFTMELVEGTDFYDYVRPSSGKLAGEEQRALDAARVRRALVQLVDALMAVHRSGRVHRDIKPTNIRVDTEERVVLLDFGLVTAAATVETAQGGVLGTPAYMAPEQCRGDAATAACDWYAVGVVLYEALTGHLPYMGNVMRILLDKQQRPPAHPRTLSLDAPEDLSDLCMRLMHITPSERPDGPAILGALIADNDALSSDALTSDVIGRASHTGTARNAPFIGRSAELARLREHYGRTRSGRPALSYVSGESGVGKSALARAFAEEIAGSEDALVFRGRCYERETVPYKAFDGIVDDLARYLSKLEYRRCRALLPGDARLLIKIFPMLTGVKALISLPEGRTPRDPNVARSLAFAALREILARIALERPVLLLIDDLQWTDLDSLSLLHEILNSYEAPACMVLATGRPVSQLASELGVALAPLLSSDYAQELPLSGLTADEAERLVRALVSQDHDAELFRRIATETRGHPLFVAELVRHVEAGHALGDSSQLDEALCQRIATLSGPTRGLLETLAIASTPTSHAVLAQALELDPLELVRRLTQLRSAHLARGENRKSAECYHDRVRRAVLDSLPAPAKRQRHRALASALSELGGSDAEQIAYQWRCAGDLLRAARYCADAARAADQALAFKRAARLYDEALTSPEAFEPEEIAQLKVAHARALSCAGFSARAAEVYLEASHGREGEEARVLRRNATQLMLRSGRIAEGLELADAVLGEIGITRPKTPTRAVMRLIWERTRLAAGGLDPAVPLRQVTEANEKSQALDLLWAVAPSLAYVDFLGGSALQSMYARMSLAHGDVQHVMRSLTNEAMLYTTMERAPQPKVTRILEQVRNAAELTKEPYHRALVFMAHGYVHWTNFRLTEAVSALVQAERLLREACIDVAWELTNARGGLLNALWNHGRLAQHDEFMSEWQRDAHERGDRNAVAQLVAIGVGYQAPLRHDAPEVADAILDAALEGWPEAFQLTHWSQYIGRQLVALYRDNGRAHVLLRETWSHIERSRLLNVPYFALLTHCDAGWACLDAAVRASGDARRELLHEAKKHAQAVLKTRWPLAQALSEQILGQVHVLNGELDVALPLLQRAESSLRAHQSVYQFSTACLTAKLMGGASGQALLNRVTEWSARENIVNPERWLAMFSPVLRVVQ